MKELILKFLDQFATKVGEEEDTATTELYMDDHICIEYENVLYYIPENNSSYTEDDELLKDFLQHSYSL